MVSGGIADLLEAPPIDLRARGFRRVTRARRAWDKRISDDIVWRISIDVDRLPSIYAGVVVPFFSACRRFTTLIPPPYDWEQEVVRNASDTRGLLAKAIDVDRPRRLLQPSLPQTSAEQMARAIDQHAMPYLERYTTLKAVLDDVVTRNGEVARKSHDKTAGYFGLCEAALLRWRLGDRAGAEADLDGADLSIARIVSSSIILWPPKDWFTKELDPEVEQFADATYAEQKAFVCDLRSFVRHHDPANPVVAIPLWPGLEDVTRTWRAGTWRKRSLKTPWKEPTLLVNIHFEDVVGIMYGPAAPGTGEAWLGPGPAYFDDVADYDVESAAEGLAAWALSATGAQPDITALRALIAPLSNVDLVEALTEMCRLLDIGLPKN
jgi:hypothetical protein